MCGVKVKQRMHHVLTSHNEKRTEQQRVPRDTTSLFFFKSSTYAQGFRLRRNSTLYVTTWPQTWKDWKQMEKKQPLVWTSTLGCTSSMVAEPILESLASAVLHLQDVFGVSLHILRHLFKSSHSGPAACQLDTCTQWHGQRMRTAEWYVVAWFNKWDFELRTYLVQH